jgi:hypothetical protein
MTNSRQAPAPSAQATSGATDLLCKRALRTHLAVVCAMLVPLLLSTAPASARPIHVLASTPAAETIMRGEHAEYVVRFDGPVDHAQSRIEILRDGHLVESLHPLLDSAPDILFASSRLPASGHYTLHCV